MLRDLGCDGADVVGVVVFAGGVFAVGLFDFFDAGVPVVAEVLDGLDLMDVVAEAGPGLEGGGVPGDAGFDGV